MTLRLVPVANTKISAALTKEQKTYHRLRKKIEQQRALLSTWQQVLPDYHAKHINGHEPLLQTLSALKMQFMFLLDSMYADKKLTKKERNKIEEIICDLASDLLDSDQRNNEPLQARQAIRDVFRKLASALHPDREQDEKERERKTELMQRVNTAYAKKDLLALLELQLEIEQINDATFATLPVNRLQHINKILNEQAEELA